MSNKNQEIIKAEINKEKITGGKHYNRFKGFITYDIEERPIEEQIEILKAIQVISTDMLEEIQEKK